jgi:hypothetical protein
MMARHASETPRSVSLDINVKLADGVVPVRRHPPAVYAFARSGQLIDKTATDASGHVQLRLPDLRVMQEVRVMVGPDTQADQSTVNELSRRGAKEQFVRISPAIEPPVLEFEIQPTLYSSWLRHCVVRGVLLRQQPRANIPIGDAGVQVWEIEPVELMIAKLPDAVVEDFRDLLLDSSGKRRADAGPRRDPDPAQRVTGGKAALDQTAGGRPDAQPPGHAAICAVDLSGKRIGRGPAQPADTGCRFRCACCCVCSIQRGFANTCWPMQSPMPTAAFERRCFPAATVPT